MRRFISAYLCALTVASLVACPAVVACQPPAVAQEAKSPPAEPKVSADEAKRIANAFLKERKSSWGEPVRVEAHDDDQWVIYATEQKEIDMLWWRTVIVNAEGRASYLPRR